MMSRLIVVTVVLLGAGGAACATTASSETAEPTAASPAASKTAETVAPSPRKPPLRRRSVLPGRGQARPGQAQLDAALAAAASGDLDGAVEGSEAAIQANPRLEQAYLLLGSSCALQGNDACEASAYQRGLEQLPESLPLQRELGVFLLRQGEVAEGLSRLESARASTPAPPPELIADLAVAYKMAGDLERARSTANTAVEASAKCTQCYMAQGEIAFAEKDFAAAEAAFARAVGLDPTSVEARRSQAKAAFLAGDVPRAAELYTDLAGRTPEDVRVQVQAGQVLMAAERAPEAVARFRAAVALYPKEPKLLELLARAQEAAGDTKGAKATRAAAAALE